MEVVQGWADLRGDAAAVLTIGVFDGVHLGHQALIRGVVQRAHALRGPAVVLTFHPHPRSVVAPESRWGYLCSLEERIARIAELGPDLLMIVRFTPEMAATSAESFVGELLRHVPLLELHVGSDFVLGRDRQGDVATLQALGERQGFVVRSVPPVCLEGQLVSSTRIRELVQAGLVHEAARWLGRAFSLRGEVVPGEGRGHRLGFPTANLHLHPRQLLPADGVYAVRVRLPPGGPWPSPRAGLAYVGRRPTFGMEGRVVEVHLLEFSGELLGNELRAEFVQRLRPDRAFPGPEALVAQMQQDTAQAREILGSTGLPPVRGRPC